MARYNGDGDRRGRPRLRVSKSVRERKREHRGATRDISASGAAVVAEPGIEDRSSVDLDIEDVGDISGHVSRLFDDGFAVVFDLDEDDQGPPVRRDSRTARSDRVGGGMRSAGRRGGCHRPRREASRNSPR